MLLSGKNKLLQTAFLQKRRQPGAPEPSRSLLKLQHKQVCRQGKSADTDRFLLQKNTVKKSHYTGENADYSKDKSSFQEKMFL